MLARRVLCVAGVAVLAGTACTMQRRMPESSRLALDDHMAGMSAADMAAPRIVRRADRQGVAGLPPSASTAKARIDASPRHGEWVKIAWEPGSKDSLMAWIVYPETSRPHTPVVVVVHEIFGLSTWIRGVADQVAANGFIAIAPDLLSRVRGGATANELPSDSAVKLIRGVAPAERNMGITAAATFAMAQPSADHKYAVIGFCWGGYTDVGLRDQRGYVGLLGRRGVLRPAVHGRRRA